MAKKKKKTKSERRGPGRPSKGPTVQVVMRLVQDLSDRIDRLRRSTGKTVTRTKIIEDLLRRGLERTS